MKEQIEKIRQTALEEIKNANDEKVLNDARVKYLGKKGELTLILRGMGGLSSEERPVIGSLVNEVRDELEEKIGKREEELSRVLTTLNQLYDEKNPYTSRPGVAGGPRPMWEMQHRQMIRDYEQQWKALEGREMLSDDEKKAIEWTNRIYDKMIEDYGLTESDFEEIAKKGIPTYYELTHPNKLEKMLTKEQPGLTIVRKIKYL